jgi:tetrapyrrole methylase family protein/MazG family protein
MPTPPKDLREIESLVQVVADLRGPEGCPWDKDQTHETLTSYAIEEVHELAEAIEKKNDAWVKEELGDVLFQVILHSQLARERKAFDLNDVIQGINEKIVRRHPHVFSEQKVSGTQEVLANWEVLKKQEKKDSDDPFALKVPAGLPALQRSAKIGFRTQKMKFDWENAEQVWEKVREEFDELEEALDSDSDENIRHEIGDMLFSLAQLARHLEMDPEQVAREANRRFETRFEKMMSLRKERGLDWEKMSLDDKEKLWQEAKKALKG